MKDVLKQLKLEVSDELVSNILAFWKDRMIDEENGGFFGRIDGNDLLQNNAPKGGVLNARILWTFSAAYRVCGNPNYLEIATYAKNYLLNNFVDKNNGGVVWQIDAYGKVIDSKKQIYNLGFAIYGLSEYFRISNDQEALKQAIDLFHLIEKHSFDPLHGGYLEAFTKEWESIDDMRLSAKDANEKKTMNTHLHILEPYTNLYRVWKSSYLKQAIEGLIEVFLTKIIQKDYHLGLFFDEQWTLKSNDYSYGHDIEAAWLIHEAALVVDNPDLLARVQNTIVKVVDAALQGYQPDGSLAYEYNALLKHTDNERHWWVQAETVVGALDAFLLTNDVKYLDIVLKTWEYIKSNIIDSEKGEWYWSRMPDGSVNRDQDKAGFWKCPYHNGRMCLEIIERLHA